MKNTTPPLSDNDLSRAFALVFSPGRTTLPPATEMTDDETLDTALDAPPELKLLRDSQRWALECLTQGRSYTEAADKANVTRKTLYNWVNKDPVFKAAMQAWRDRITLHAQDRLTQAVNFAAQTLGRAATKDVRAAIALLKGLGMLNGQRPGAPADPALAQLNTLPPAKRRAVELRLREMILSFREEPQTPADSVAPVSEFSAPSDAGVAAPAPAIAAPVDAGAAVAAPALFAPDDGAIAAPVESPVQEGDAPEMWRTVSGSEPD